MGTVKACVVMLICLLLTALILAMAVTLGNMTQPAGAHYEGDTHENSSLSASQDLGQEAGTVSPAEPQDQTPTPRPPATWTGTPYVCPTCRPTGHHEGCCEPEPGEDLVPWSWLPFIPVHKAGPTATQRPTPGPAWTPTATRRPPPIDNP